MHCQFSFSLFTHLKVIELHFFLLSKICYILIALLFKNAIYSFHKNLRCQFYGMWLMKDVNFTLHLTVIFAHFTRRAMLFERLLRIHLTFNPLIWWVWKFETKIYSRYLRGQPGDQVRKVICQWKRIVAICENSRHCVSSSAIVMVLQYYEQTWPLFFWNNVSLFTQQPNKTFCLLNANVAIQET